MRTIKRLLITLALAACFCGAKAQYYQMANQFTNMISTAINGGFMYRGMVDASYQRGLGDNSVNILELTSTQGLKYASWFYMGVGAGVDVLFSQPGGPSLSTSADGTKLTETGCMVPLYSDFRFNIGGEQSTSFFIDARIGASFLIGKNKLRVGDGYISRSECFYLRPSAGIRIPVSKSNPKLAVNASCAYTLLCTSRWWGGYDNVNLSALGFNLGFEW